MNRLNRCKRLFAAALALMLVLACGTVVHAAAGDKPNPSGAYIKYTVNITKKEDGPTLAYCFNNFKNIGYVIEDGDMLEYDVVIYIDEAGWGHIDGSISGADSNIFRGLPLQDTDGTTVHPLGDLAYSAFGKWYHRAIDLSDIAGAKWNMFQLAMHPDSPELEYSGVVLYDNIVITNNGAVKCVIFRDAEDFPADSKFSANPSQSAKATVELLVFTDEDMKEFAAMEEKASIEAASIEASKAEAEASREASREAAKNEASQKQSEEDASRAASEAEEASNREAEKSSADSEGSNLGFIIALAGGAAALVVVVIVIIAISGKKKKENKK